MTHLQWTAMGPVRLASSWWARACSTSPRMPWVEPGTSPESSAPDTPTGHSL